MSLIYRAQVKNFDIVDFTFFDQGRPVTFQVTFEHGPFIILYSTSKICYFKGRKSGLDQILLKKCIGRRYGKFPDLLIFEIRKWNSPFWIALNNFKNIQKFFLKKVDYRGRYSSIFKTGTALGKRGVATSILKLYPCHHHHLGANT